MLSRCAPWRPGERGGQAQSSGLGRWPRSPGAGLEGAVSLQAFLAKHPSSPPLLTRKGQSLPPDPRLRPGVVRVISCNVYPVVSVYSAS